VRPRLLCRTISRMRCMGSLGVVIAAMGPQPEPTVQRKRARHAVHDAPIRVFTMEPIRVFTMLRSACSRCSDLRVHVRPESAVDGGSSNQVKRQIAQRCGAVPTCYARTAAQVAAGAVPWISQPAFHMSTADDTRSQSSR
jgi:hypothetical protein